MTSPDDTQTSVSLTLPVALISVLAIVAAAIPMLFLDPEANDGAAFFVGVFGVPMLAVAIVIQVALSRLGGGRTARGRGWLWWILLVMPVGILVLCIPAMMRNPTYFDAESSQAAFGSLFGMALLLVMAMLCGGLVWFFVVFPLVGLVGVAMMAYRGDPVPTGSFVLPVVLLGVTAVIVVCVLIFGG